jgi:hemerythrin-like domain-containing protein
MSIIQRFREDHQAFRLHLEQVKRIAKALPPDSPKPPQTEADRTFAHRLRRHARMEAEILFPSLQRASNGDHRHETVKRFIDHGQDEHFAVAKRHSVWMADSTPNVCLSQWQTALHHFAEGLERHMQMEEDELFPMAEKILSQEVLAELNQKAESIP